jgi:hypothetical protein
MKIDRNQSAETTSLGSEPNSSIYRDTAQRFSPTGVMLRLKLCCVEGDHKLSYWPGGILLAT